MNVRNILVLTLSLVVLSISLASFSSAYYDDNYKTEYYEKRSYDPYYGHQYVQKEVSKTPWQETTKYIKIKDGEEPSYSYTYKNKVNTYWDYGPRGAPSKQYLGDYWDDSWRHSESPDMYRNYYYQPKYYDNGDYYDWRDSSGIRCKYDRYC